VLLVTDHKCMQAPAWRYLFYFLLYFLSILNQNKAGLGATNPSCRIIASWRAATSANVGTNGRSEGGGGEGDIGGGGSGADETSVCVTCAFGAGFVAALALVDVGGAGGSGVGVGGGGGGRGG
jgi:hypothetical protein